MANNGKDLKNRWSEVSLIEGASSFLKGMFEGKMAKGPYDLRGLVIGTESPIDFLRLLNLHQARLEDIDLSFAEIGASMAETHMKRIKFSHALFDRVRLNKANIEDCDFSQAKLTVTMDAALIKRCDFSGAVFKGAGTAEYGGRRVRFEGCVFANVQFNKVEFRASQFVGCDLTAARFFKCDLRGAKFEGSVPSLDQFDKCEMPEL